MTELLPIGGMVVGLAAVLGGVVWLGRRIRRSRKAFSATSGAAAAYEQTYRPHAYDAHVEITAQRERQAAPTPVSETADDGCFIRRDP